MAGILTTAWSWRAARLLALSVPMLVSASLVVFALTQPLALWGANGYDEGVYFGAALRFAGGALPYRDFVLVHPPGIILLLFPLTVLSQFTSTADGLAVARILTGIVAVLNVGLIGYVLRRHGPITMCIAAMLLAVHPFAVASTHTILLDPWMLLFCLAALAVTFDGQGRFASNRRLVVGGLLLGVGISIKIWGLFFLLPLLVVAVVRRRRPALAGIGGGALLSFMSISGWFMAASPGGFIRDVVRAQLGREGQGKWQLPFEKRLSLVLGLDQYPFPQGDSRAVIAAALVIAVVVILVLVAVLFRRPRDVDITLIGVSVLASVAFALSTDFYYAYAYVCAAGLILGIGTALGLGIALVRSSHWWRSQQHSIRRGLGALVMVPLVAATIGVMPVTLDRIEEYFPEANGGVDSQGLLRATIPSGSCVAFEYPGALIAADRYQVDDRECPKVIDPLGSYFSLNDGRLFSIRDRAICDVWLESLSAADYVVTQKQGSYLIAWCNDVRSYFASNFFSVASDAAIEISARRPSSP